MLKSLQRFLVLTLLLIGGLYLAYALFLYGRARQLLPPRTTVAGVAVGGLPTVEAVAAVEAAYQAPVIVYYEDNRIELLPQDVGFVMDAVRLVDEAAAQQAQQAYWQGFLQFLFKQSLDPIEVPLQATHDRDLLADRLAALAAFLDSPAKPPQLLVGASSFQYGEAGYVADVAASLADVEAALYRTADRQARLQIVAQPEPPLSLDLLAENIAAQLEAFGGIGSVYVMDLQTGEEISINGDVAISGLSILKIAIFLETYRVLDQPPNEYVQGLLEDTAIRSSNYGANLLLHVIAGEDNTYAGADALTAFFQRLGLENSFMAVPYDANVVAGRPSTHITPANSDPDLVTRPDPAMQTTAAEMGTLLSMIYYCAQGKGALLAIYPDEITPTECQAIMDLMVRNVEGNLIRFGVPEDVAVSHKHGWDFVTQGDAGIVFSPGGDFVLVEY
ncbi:MAG: serine hydrolase, partial [Anaerolineales bacterium]|nr:serine hydrolase [Anaerolineales bacterium]